MKTDVSGTEAFFKAIVAGDPISACYKGKDFISFKPFCKLAFSTNQLLTSREIDRAMLRRFCFLMFPVTYVDEPKKENERKKDPMLTERLLNELPGIFNWALIGLKQLREDGHFQNTIDQDTQTEELYRMNHPLVSFVEDKVEGNTRFNGEVNAKNVYLEYRNWCDDTGANPMSARMFWPRLMEVYPYTKRKSKGERYIRFDKQSS